VLWVLRMSGRPLYPAPAGATGHLAGRDLRVGVRVWLDGAPAPLEVSSVQRARGVMWVRFVGVHEGFTLNGADHVWTGCAS
jgi:hypothetical protein